MQEILQRIVPIFGLAVMIGGCLLFSTNRKLAIKRWDLIAWAIGLQVILGVLVLKVSVAQSIVSYIDRAFIAIVDASLEGGKALFGPLVGGNVATADYVRDLTSGADPATAFNNAFIFAVQLFPTIIVFAAITTILYHLRVLQWVVYFFAIIMQKTLKTSGAETLCTAANIFVGQTEAPLVSRPYVPKMTNSELMTIMTAGFATVAGSVLGLYVLFLKDHVDGVAGHLITASIMSAPAALLFSKVLVPEEGTPETMGKIPDDIQSENSNVLDAAATGTSEGMRLALNVIAMLITFIALVAILNYGIQWVAGDLFNAEDPSKYSLQAGLGYLFFPLAWLMGITDPAEALQAARFMGTKMAVNEFVAFLDLSNYLKGENVILTDRTTIILSYALAGFANFSSIGIQIGGISVLAPERRKDLSRLAIRAMLAGTLAANATGCIVAILI